MKTIWRSSVFDKWLDALKDVRGKASILVRIKRLAAGNPGDARPVGNGISELRFFFGPGYRVYYKDTGRELILLLCGGNKSTQEEDIARAKEIADTYGEKE
ncbi:MAG: type II toxin-antitoxin system RelE/ParE family toxin [Spirochaetaceae bacterium]|jgi:putative addiction module killer protein|nr:type II toxin-antitoxin system RelE/ParE family toxin [Spirochaetaceae bacterium]